MVNGTNYGGNEEALLNEKGSIVYAYILACVAAVGGLLFGYDIGVISGAIDFVKINFELNEHWEGFTAACAMIGCIFGALLAGILSDKYGRKKVLIGTAFLYALSALWSALPHSWAELVLARFVGGLAVGISAMVSPMYIAEISPARIRGRLVAINQLAIVCGMNLSYIANWLLVNVGQPECPSAVMTALDNRLRSWFGFDGDTNWRWMFGAEAIPSIALFFGLFFVPESPRWLTKQGWAERALRILARIGGRQHAREEMEEIQLTLAMEEEKGSVFQLLKPGLRTVLFIGIALAILQQISGANTVLFYAPKIFQKIGYQESESAFWNTVLVGTTFVICTLIALAVIDKMGRKPLLMIGAAGMSLSLVLMGLLPRYESISDKWTLAAILAYIALYAVSLAPVVWVLLSEIFPTDIRGRAMSIATFGLWVSCYAVTQTFPYLWARFGENTFLGYAAICAFAFFFVAYIVKETKGKTLEEIERSWKR
ncbi:MAG: sugar porter family MFS transporter [Planctomycetota bacterium]|nr:MAG: sugar porter family MFS transporter [Planctomycetota bacterium]